MNCPTHGPTVAVPWARHHAPGTDDTGGLLAVACSKTAVRLMRIAWRTVGAIAPGPGPTPSALTGLRTCAASVSM